MEENLLRFIFGFVFGSIFGSFSNFLSYRIGRRVSLTENSSRSFCPNCLETLSASDLVPILSYLFLRGRCRYCNSPIPIRYLLLEVAMAFFFGLSFLLEPSPARIFSFCWLIFWLLTISVIDLEAMFIPSRPVLLLFFLNLILSLSGLTLARPTEITVPLPDLFSPLSPFLSLFFQALCVCGLVYFVGFLFQALFRKEGLGLGDVDLFLAISAFFGLKYSILIFFISFGLFGPLSFLLFRKKEFPFGPSIALSAITVLFLHSEIEKLLSLWIGLF